MTDCTKLQPKVVYSQEFRVIIGSVLPSNQTKVFIYKDIYITMKLIQENNAVANQIRGFILKIPISKIPPVIITAIPTKGDINATEINQLLLDIINITAHAGINLLSIGTDRAIAEMKYPKHTKKTARNQIHYSSKLLTFGNDTIHYDQLLELAQFSNSPICVRDVRNVNKQDDATTY
ncbi:hypothetical protein C1646_752805 [Rhizophagus diaphanus]|nr:hypothetical protein C1646_752805 [Rhizophagus diaphanus] [Rhizophagus sp. MUCL 43196]